MLLEIDLTFSCKSKAASRAANLLGKRQPGVQPPDQQQAMYMLQGCMCSACLLLPNSLIIFAVLVKLPHQQRGRPRCHR